MQLENYGLYKNMNSDAMHCRQAIDHLKRIPANKLVSDQGGQEFREA